jgi:hypothetical protein
VMSCGGPAALSSWIAGSPPAARRRRASPGTSPTVREGREPSSRRSERWWSFEVGDAPVVSGSGEVGGCRWGVSTDRCAGSDGSAWIMRRDVPVGRHDPPGSTTAGTSPTVRGEIRSGIRIGCQLGLGASHFAQGRIPVCPDS